MGYRSTALLISLVLEVWLDASLGNVTRTTLSGIDEYRSALTLDSFAAEDLKQRELVTASTTELTTTNLITINCLVYPRPSYGKVTKLMLELFRYDKGLKSLMESSSFVSREDYAPLFLRNLESNNGLLVSDLMRVRVRLKLLMKFSMFDSESNSKSLSEKPKLMKNEIHATFSRILAILWLEVTDGTTTWNNDWCPMKKVTEYVTITDPVDIAKHLRELKPLLAQVRDIMEEFIQSITPPSHQKTIPGQKVFEKDYYSVGNITEAPLSEIDAYRSALNLDWKVAKDFRQRELVPALPAKSIITKCSEYPKPPFGDVAKLMLELLRNLEGENGVIMPELIRVLMKSKLLLENPMKDSETDTLSHKVTPKIVIGAPHYTLSRILAIVWILISDVTLTSKRGWCPIVNVNEYLASTKPKEIENHLHVLGPLVARARFIMEEFIQAITPLNIYQEETSGPTHLEKVAKHEDEVLWSYTSLRPYRKRTQDLQIQESEDIYEKIANNSTLKVHVSIATLIVLFYVYSFIVVL